MLTLEQYAKGATIPQNYLNNARFTVGILNEIFDTFPNQFTFNSGYRTPARNKAVGGVANSFHIQALAGDITPRNGNYNQYKPALMAILAKYDWQLIDERKKNHFHIEPRTRQMTLTAPNQQPDGAIVHYDQPEPQTLEEQFNSLSPQSKTLIIGFGLLALVLILSD